MNRERRAKLLFLSFCLFVFLLGFMVYDSLTLWIKSRIVSSAICLNFIFKLFDLLLSPSFFSCLL